MRRTSVVAVAGYVAAFLALTFPLVTSPRDHVISHWDADVEHSLWVQWWFEDAVESPGRDLFTSDRVAFPEVVDLQLADINLAVNGLGYLLGKLLPLAAAYNAALLLAFVLAGAATARLLHRLGAEGDVAWLGGLVFAASPYWLASTLNGWGYLVHTWVLPVVFLALLCAHRRADVRGGLALGLALALGFHVTPYYFVYALVTLALLIPWQREALATFARRPGALACGLAALGSAALLILPRAWPMAAAASGELAVHHGPQNTALAAPLLEWLWPSASVVAARAPDLGYLVVFLGACVPLGLALGLACGARSRSLAMWLVTAGVLALLALGPELRWTHERASGLPLPAAWLQELPVFRLTTNHWRWSYPAGFCLVVAFALALTHLRLRRSQVALVAVVFLVEALWLWPFPLRKPLWDARTHPIAEQLRERRDVHAVLDRTDRRKLNQTVHGKAIALGWLPRMEARTRRANESMARHCRGAPPICLRRYGIDAIVRDPKTALLLRSSGVEELRAP